MSTPRIFETMSIRARKTTNRTIDPTLHGAVVPSASVTAGVTSVTREPRTYTTTFTLSGVAVSLVDATTAGAHGSIQLVDFAQGNIRFLGATSNIALVAGAGITAGGALVCGVGSAVAANDNAALSGTEQNVIPSTSVTLTSSAGTFAGESTGTEGAITLDGTGTAVDLFLNIVATDAHTTGSGPFTVTCTGTITVTWTDLGDS